jgi:hypothetical protein
VGVPDCAQVDASGRLTGMLSEADLLWKGAGAPLDHTIIPPVGDLQPVGFPVGVLDGLRLAFD